MDRKELQKHVRELATLPETEAPILSCYLNLRNGLSDSRQILSERFSVLRRVLTPDLRRYLNEAIGQIDAYVRSEPLVGYDGVAFFSRGGSQPYFLALRFYVPVPSWVSVDFTPHIYHLVELKDTYDRYVILLATKKEARILEVNLGEVTKQLWDTRPDIRKRVGREWTKAHYQRLRKEQTDRFIKEKIKVLEKLMQAGDHSYLILAGDPRMVARVREHLPAHLTARLVDSVVASNKKDTRDLVQSTLAAFIEHEQNESQAAVERLLQHVYRDGLAVVGVEKSLRALQAAQADQVVLDAGFEAPPGWQHVPSGHIGAERNLVLDATDGLEGDLREVDLKEEMIRLAELHGCDVEIVEGSKELAAVGGVGCLLRYR